MSRAVSFFFVCLLLLPVSRSFAEEPLHERIDRLIASGAEDIELGPRAGDTQFLRRVYLDLAGRIPTLAETKRFLADSSPEKRAQLIDRLLASDEYPRRMQELFDAMLMERRGENEEWARFLRLAFEENMPWDEVARLIIKPQADQEHARGAAYFFTARLVSEGAMAPVDVPGLTRDVGRLLAGVDLQCAQCHDHISIEQYKQRDFQGLHMIFENVQQQRGVEFPAIAEKLMTEKKEFMSVFEQVPKQTGPVVPGGKEVEIVTFEKGEQYAVPPDRKKRTPGEPKFSPLAELAAGLASRDNELFCRNIANRLWFVTMGRGLVEPLDLQHQANPPTHPGLLDLLARRFAEEEFDIKWLLRELARTETYQRASVVASPEEAPPERSYARAVEKRISAESLFWSVMIATGELDLSEMPAEKTKADARTEASKEAAKQDDEGRNDTEKPQLPRTLLERKVAASESLTKLQEKFMKVFANPPKEPEVDFEPTVKAALFLMHDDDVLRLLEPREGNLVARLLKHEDDNELADELFLSVLSRKARGEEKRQVAEHLGEHSSQRAEAVGQLVWALLASTEFVVNH